MFSQACMVMLGCACLHRAIHMYGRIAGRRALKNKFQKMLDNPLGAVVILVQISNDRRSSK